MFFLIIAAPLEAARTEDLAGHKAAAVGMQLNKLEYKMAYDLVTCVATCNVCFAGILLANLLLSNSCIYQE